MVFRLTGDDTQIYLTKDTSKPSKPDNGDNDKPSDSNKPAATRPSASDKKADSKNDGKKQGLAKTGVDVAVVAGALVALAVLGAGFTAVRRIRR